ncbi:MAG: hypothetical protein ACHP8B_14130 [Terriglobales bacterium]
MKAFIGGILGGLLGSIGVAFAAIYIGYNPANGVNAIPGQWTDPTALQAITSDNGCTFDTQHGGTNIGSMISRTSGTCHLTFVDNTSAQASAAGITGYTCIVIDEDAASYLTPFKQTANDGTGCTVSGSTASGDHLTFIMIGYGN